MPRTPHVENLQQCCLLNIAQNMEKLWLADYAKNFLDQGHFLHILGPFDCLTPALIQKLILVLAKRKLMKRYFLHVLIDARMNALDLSTCKFVANKDSIISLVSLRCQKLTSLSLAGCNQVSARTLADLVKGLPGLITLNLRQTKCSDQVISIIGHNCTSLRDLTLFGCPVSDMGIMSLCVSFDPSHPKCSQLRRLNVGCTGVSVKGAEIALQNLRLLQHLVYGDVCEAVYQLHQADPPASKPEDTQLHRLSILTLSHGMAPPDQVLEVSCRYCPGATEAHITKSVTNSSLHYLSSLEELKVLSLANSDEESVTFEDGLLPLLLVRGVNLTELSLSEINNLDLGAIAACCPELKKISCLIAGFPRATFPMYQHPEILSEKKNLKRFTKLESARILLYTPENNFPEQYIRLLLLHSSRIQEIHFAMIDALNDDLFEQILEHNPLTELEKFCLESCHNVTAEPVYNLLNLKNKLSNLVLKDCQEILRRDHDEMLKLAQQNNYQMEIIWT